LNTQIPSCLQTFIGNREGYYSTESTVDDSFTNVNNVNEVKMIEKVISEIKDEVRAMVSYVCVGEN